MGKFQWVLLVGYFYPRSPCGERLHFDNFNLHCVEISIHALLAESDRKITITVDEGTLISIHALLAESDCDFRCSIKRPVTFLSTLSLRRATYHRLEYRNQDQHFYPRSPCGERLGVVGFGRNNNANFYPRSPCGERQRTLESAL